MFLGYDKHPKVVKIFFEYMSLGNSAFKEHKIYVRILKIFIDGL